MIKPLGSRILLKPYSSTATNGGILLADMSKHTPTEGLVVAVGPGRVLKNGDIVKVGVEVGDSIVYSRYKGEEIRIGGEKHLILDEEDILIIKG